MVIYPPQVLREKLGNILAWSAHAAWWETPVPELGNRTPADLWRTGERCRVVDLVENYGRDVSFT